MSSDSAYPGWRSWQPIEPDREPRLWVEHETPLEPWTAAYAFVSRGEDLTLCEVRLFPTRDTPADRSPNVRKRRRGLGEWSGDLELVPESGMPARVLRLLKPGEALNVALASVLQSDTPAGNAGAFSVRADRAARKPSKPRRDPRLLARVAVLYDQAMRSGSACTAPNRYVYERLQGTEHQLARRSIEAIVTEARQVGYLTPATKGRPSGRATAAAHALWSL